jgi:hypothetical protein
MVAVALPLGVASGIGVMLINPPKRVIPGEFHGYEVGGCVGCFLAATVAIGMCFMALCFGMEDPDEVVTFRMASGFCTFAMGAVVALTLIAGRKGRPKRSEGA